ncbi:uncharacterized protein LOC127245002 [Andrographis paniculata]|uniref:uncharacterized protein LOC127245002 n=1 Tax=Andrographis paniculata TaxID=175694 RepID=UPI0021E96114|nr:uncharacterized protein LOC127245002 [Andrographis paniculata]XP_051121611.1 uncharacterized protein LOC127245002 [Andrographis paniculata]XP_051121617.1 uncharacterized protein LOC127245002 [Andrographis paniculata]XP_051121622.1 uncharacterized protein LOC127245002 [Andrographis paniculata]
MAKRSQRRPSRAQAGCIWSLISIFAFRNGKSTRRLLSDRKRVSKQTPGSGPSSSQIILSGQIEKCEDNMHTAVTDAVKTSVKELIEVDMFNEQSSRTNLPKDSELSREQINSRHKNKTNSSQKRRNRSSIKSWDMDISALFGAAECFPEHSNNLPEDKPPDDLDLEKLMDELSQISQSKMNCSKHDELGDLDTPSNHAAMLVEEKIAAAIKTVIEERMSGSPHFGEQGNILCSKDFVDALQTLSLNKGLFLKILQDSNSALVKHIQNFEEAQMDKGRTLSPLPGSNLSEEKHTSLKSDESSGRKHRNFFRRRSKSLDTYPSGVDKDPQSLNKIVIWKPLPAGSQSLQTGIPANNSSYDKIQNDRNASHFSFTEIKRKLRHAMGKDRQGISPDRLIPKLPSKPQVGINGNKGASGEALAWRSPNRNHFYTERFAVSSPKKGEAVDKVKDKGSLVENEHCQYSRPGVSNIYIEAKKHLSEMLNNGDDVEPIAGLLPKSLGRILSLPEYNGSPSCSPRRRDDGVFITAQMRLSPQGTSKNNVGGLFQEKLNDHPSPRRQNLESQPCVPSIVCQDKEQSLKMNADDLKCRSELRSFTQDATTPEASEIEERTESKIQEEESVNGITPEPSGTSLDGDLQKVGASEVDNGENASATLNDSIPSFKLDLYGKDQISPPHSPLSSKTEDSDRGCIKVEQPSPISILEPLFTDEDISPASSMSRSGGKEIQPRHINFEEQSSTSEQGICTRISQEGEESAFEYVEAVLLGSGLNWDDFLSRWLSSYKILDSSLFDEVELFSSRPRHDQKLLFDSANESLKEVCESYFGCFTGISRDKPNNRPVPKGMDLIHEIWQRVEGHLFSHPQPPPPLDQLVKIDLANSGKWMYLQSDIELIGSEMEETIFDEFLDDCVMSFIDGVSELELSVFQTDPQSNYKAIEVTVLCSA